jgi:hypothetical protein
MSDTSTGSRPASGRSPKTKANPNAKAKQSRAPAEGVLANLPRTRPQRSSARRDAARRDSKPATAARQAVPAAAKTSPAQVKRVPKPRVSKPPVAKPRVAKPRVAKPPVAKPPLQDPAPRQGFETERDPVSGPVQPPGGADLFASAAELAGELTKNGLASGGRLLKDVLARLPLN